MRSRRLTAANRRNSIAGRWRPWLWDAETTPDDMVAQDAAELPLDAPAREQIPLWSDDAASPPSQGPQLRLE
jgi:hypothetical protein